ncbi:hypothetical protein JZ751_002175, partial [Albula glossodonta]
EQLEKQRKSERFQTRWIKHIERITVAPKQEPVCLAISRSPAKDKKLKTGLLHSLANGRDSALGPGGSVASSSLEYLQIIPSLPRTPQPIRRLEMQPPLVNGQGGLEVPMASGVMVHSWDSMLQDLSPAQSPPCLMLSNGPLSPFHINSVRKAPIPGSPSLISPAPIQTLEPESPTRMNRAFTDPMGNF